MDVRKLMDESFEVVSHSDKGKVYRVTLDPRSCDCPHFKKRLASAWESGEGENCKHIEDVLIFEGKMEKRDRKKNEQQGEWLSKNRYRMDEVTSAIQKSIVRGVVRSFSTDGLE